MQQPQQVTFAFGSDEAPVPGRPTDPERERQLLQLMTQALTAVLRNREGDKNEPA
jgi:hypothetical protein